MSTQTPVRKRTSRTRAQAKPAPAAKSEEGIFEGYDGKRTPLGGYATLMSAFVVVTGVGLWAASRKRPAKDQPLQDGVDVKDLVLLGVATHKLSRIITKDWVTAPVRAPFTHYEGMGEGGEAKESGRGEGIQLATGQLLTCPFCAGGWVASMFTIGYALKPRLTRMIASIFAVQAISDRLHLTYDDLRKREE